MFGRNSEAGVSAEYGERLTALAHDLIDVPDHDPSVIQQVEDHKRILAMQSANYDPTIIGHKEKWESLKKPVPHVPETRVRHGHRLERGLKVGVRVLLVSGLVGLVKVPSHESELTPDASMATYEETPESSTSVIPSLLPGEPRKPQKTTTTKKPKSPKKTTTSSSIRPTEVPTPKPVKQRLRALDRPEVANNPELKKSLENIDNMNLTREGYIKTLSSINTDFYAYAQSKPDFNPSGAASRGIPQNPTIFITKHYTAHFYNSDGAPATTASGTPNVKLLIDSMADRDPGVCCGINQFTDRNGLIYWLAPYNAKLRHNVGFDGQTTGNEKEAYKQSDLKVVQLESSAYLDVGLAVARDKWIDPSNPDQVWKELPNKFRGHERTRRDYNINARQVNAKHGRQVIKEQPGKPDYDDAEMDAYLQRLGEFIIANPDLAAITPASFYNLP